MKIHDALRREEHAKLSQERIGASALPLEQKEVMRTEFNRQLSLRSAADVTAEKAARHRLEALAPLLPANPRQIKRIINVISLLQEAARIKQGTQPGSPEWAKLALWIVLMVEWPKSWFSLSTYPGLADRLRNPRSKKAHLPVAGLDAYLAALKDNDTVSALLNFKSEDAEWGDCTIHTKDILLLREVAPPASGELLVAGRPTTEGIPRDAPRKMRRKACPAARFLA